MECGTEIDDRKRHRSDDRKRKDRNRGERGGSDGGWEDGEMMKVKGGEGDKLQSVT